MTADTRPVQVWLPLDVDEQDFVTADYTDMLEDGETVASVYSVTCTLLFGADPTPASRLLGPPSISSPVVSQLMGGVVNGANYLVRFTCTTSAGRRLVIAGSVLGTKVGEAEI